MVAAALPVASLVVFDEFDAADPFGALPGIELRDHAADRAAVVGRNRLAVVQVGKQRIFGEKIGERQVRRPAIVVAMTDDEMSIRFNPGPFQ